VTWSGRAARRRARRTLLQAQSEALGRYAQRRDAAPASAPRVELTDDERYAVRALMDHVIRLLAPTLRNHHARALLTSGLRVLEDEAATDAAAAAAQHLRDLAALPQTTEPTPTRPDTPTARSVTTTPKRSASQARRRRFTVAAAWAAVALFSAAIVLVVSGGLGIVLAITACGYAIGALAAALLIRSRRPGGKTHKRSR
jgi:hypothetical protein